VANLWYGKAIQHFANGDINWGSNTIKVALVSSGYSAAPSTDEFYSVAVSGGNIVSAGVTLGSKTNVLGLLSAANTTWTSVTGSQVTQLVGYVAGGSPGTNDYILFNDSVGTNLPVTPNGGNITASWDAVNGIGTLMAALSPKDRRTLGQLLGDFMRDLWTHVKDPDTGLWVPQPVGALCEPTIILG
jgi:hypothetical protein